MSKTRDLADSAEVINFLDGVTSNIQTQITSNSDSLSTVATTGSYNDLSDLPTIPVDVSELTDTTQLLTHFDGDYNSLTNTPTLFDGSYTSLTDTPAIPSLTGYATETYVDTAVGAINPDPTKATLSKTFLENESYQLTLSEPITSGCPVVSVTKEIPQTGSTNNSWDVNSTTENYTRLDSAYDTTLDFEAIGFTLSTASFVDSFSVAAQETGPYGMAFNNDGTKMFIVGNVGADVNEYTLSTGFDVSTATYSQNFSVSSQDGSLTGIAFNTDGTKMFIVGRDAEDVNEYTLSTGFDVSTASFVDSFSVSAQDGNPWGLAFNSDGTKMFIVGYDGDDVNEYTLSTGFDVSTASYSQNFSVNSQETEPRGIAFNTDGTKMFVVGSASDAVNEYTLSTGFDLSTASFSGTSFSIAAQEIDSQAIAFSSDGTKMFIVGSTGDDVNEYNLTPDRSLVLGTGSFASADVGKTIEANSGVFVLTATDGSYAETTAPTSYDQVASGDWGMYGVAYNAVDGDLELSSYFNGYDLLLASYDSINFSVSTQEGSPSGITFNNDGTKMFIIGNSGHDVNQYTLSQAWNVSTASFVNTFSVNSQESTPEGIAFNNNGTKMFIIGEASDNVTEYALSTAFDSSSASFTASTSVASQDSKPFDLAFNNDGTKLFVVGEATKKIFEYSLSTAFDVTTLSYTSQSLDVVSEENAPEGIAFNSDGTKLFIVGIGGDKVNQYNLSTGFDLSTASFSGTSFSVAAQDTSPRSMAFSSDGAKMYILGNQTDSVYQYSTSEFYAPTGYQPVHTTTSIDSTYWTDINSMTADQAAGDGNVYYAISTDDRTTWTVIKNGEGERDIVRNNGGTWQYNSNGTYASETWTNGTTNTELATLAEAMEGALSVTNAFNISIASYSQSFSVASQDIEPQDIAFSTNGNKMFIVGNAGDDINEYTLSTAFDVSTASFVDSFSVSGQDSGALGMAFNLDGTKMFVVGAATDAVYEYTLSTGFDVSTSTYSQSFSVASQEAVPNAIAFNTDGTKMFILGGNGDDVNEYTLSTGFDISTASYSQNFSVAAQEISPSGIAFNNDGTKMFILGNNGDDVNEYTLSTGFDVSTASYSQNFSVASQDNYPTGIAFSPNGSKMFVVGITGDNVYEYTIGSTSYTNQMDKTQLDAVTDPNHIALGNDLDLAIIFNMTSGTTVPSSDGVAINYDANVLNKGAVLGTD